MKDLKHKWKISDDIVAFYLYKHGSEKDIENVSRKLGIKVASIKMRISNFAFLDKQKGLSKFSKQTQNVYSIWRNSSSVALKAEYKNIFSNVE